MKTTRPRALLAAGLVLIISACSQTPLNSTSDTLTPQFGTPDNSSVDQLAVNETGVYLGGSWNGKPSLIKFGRTGNIPWVRGLPGGNAEVALDSRSNAYVVLQSLTDNPLYFIRKYTQNGTLLWQRQPTFTYPTGTGYPDFAADVDAQNNFYLSIVDFDSTGGKTELRKYRPDGSLLYNTPGEPADVCVGWKGAKKIALSQAL